MVPKMKARAAYSYDVDAASDEAGLRCLDESLTKQAFAEECDINTIVRRFGLTGELPVGVRMPTYGDFEGVSDFHSAMNAVAKARESFDTMPAHVRARFHNDPGEFVDFCSDEANRAEAEKLGLVEVKVAAAAAALVGGAVVPAAAPAAPVGGSEAKPTVAQ